MTRALVFVAPFLIVLTFPSCGSSSSNGVKLETGQACPATAQVVPTRHIPPVTNQMTDLGPTDAGAPLAVAFALKLNHEAELDAFLGELYQPESAKYHQFLSSGEFLDRYAPTADQVAKVQAYLRAHGVAPGEVSGNRLFVHASGGSGSLAALLRTELHRYRTASGEERFAPSRELVLPEGLTIRAVHGLQNITRFHGHLHVRPAASIGGGVSGGQGTGPQGGMSPADIRAAYGFPNGTTGAGQTLALFELDGYAASDIATYSSQFGLPSVPLQNVLIDSASGAAGNSESEVDLDIEMMNGIAPGAARIVVYEGTNDEQGILDTYARIASDDLAPQISSSWGGSEDESSTAFLNSENTIFKQMAAQGQSLFASSGDSGAYTNGSSLTVDDPASQPFVTGVGGTHLTVGSGSTYVSESTWNSGSISSGAGGGGNSTVWSAPSWQLGLPSSANGGSSSMRMVPDVSFDADPASGYAIASGGTWEVVGGTSAAAPIWAALTALVNQRRLAAGMSGLGYANPALYAIASSSRYGADFFDIADGSTNLHYAAVKGYDLATGWGSPKAASLISDLSTPPSVSGATPTSGTPGAPIPCSEALAR